MRNLDHSDHQGSGLTRISVRSTRDVYEVKIGPGPAVKVRRCGQRLTCECGRTGCEHIKCLQICGFVRAAEDFPMAA